MPCSPAFSKNKTGTYLACWRPTSWARALHSNTDDRTPMIKVLMQRASEEHEVPFTA